MKTKICKSAFVLFIFILLTGCEVKNFDYFAQPTCEPPCFMGITPARTNTLEAIDLLKSSPYIEVPSIDGSGMITRNWYPVSYSLEWDFVDRSKGVVWLSSESKVVNIDFIDPHISLSEFAKIYGNPSGVIISPYWGVKTHVYLLYPEIGVVLEIDKLLKKQQTVNIFRRDPISTITYVDKDLFYRFVHFYVFGDALSEKPLDELASIIQPWKGYGHYSLIDYWSSD